MKLTNQVKLNMDMMSDINKVIFCPCGDIIQCDAEVLSIVSMAFIIQNGEMVIVLNHQERTHSCNTN